MTLQTPGAVIRSCHLSYLPLQTTQVQPVSNPREPGRGSSPTSSHFCRKESRNPAPKHATLYIGLRGGLTAALIGEGDHLHWPRRRKLTRIQAVILPSSIAVRGCVRCGRCFLFFFLAEVLRPQSRIPARAEHHIPSEPAPRMNQTSRARVSVSRKCPHGSLTLREQ